MQAQGEVKAVEAALHQHLNDRIARFQQRYADRLPEPIAIHPTNAVSSWESLLTAVSATPHQIYLLIDEYDNFANEVLMAGRDGGRDRYEALLYGEGCSRPSSRRSRPPPADWGWTGCSSPGSRPTCPRQRQHDRLGPVASLGLAALAPAPQPRPFDLLPLHRIPGQRDQAARQVR